MQRKIAVTDDNNVLRSFCKGCGEPAKQRCGQNARWSRFAKVEQKRKDRTQNAKVRSKRKGFSVCAKTALWIYLVLSSVFSVSDNQFAVQLLGIIQ